MEEETIQMPCVTSKVTILHPFQLTIIGSLENQSWKQTKKFELDSETTPHHPLIQTSKGAFRLLSLTEEPLPQFHF